jgi:hypothetical protein
MGDRRRPSLSDELLGRARAGTGSGSDTEDFAPRSPADEYFSRNLAGGDPEPVASPDEPLDAAAIADELLEAGQITSEANDEPRREPAIERGESSLPSWATDDPPAAGKPLRPDDTPSPVIGPAETVEPGREPLDAGFDEVIAGEGDRWATPSAEWEQREAERRARAEQRFDIPVPRLRTLVSLAVFGFFAIGVLIPIFSGLEPIADATVGDCFTVGEALEVDDIEVVSCSEPHDSELFLRVDMVPAFGTSLPDDDRAFEWLFEQCLEAFPAYTGESYEESRYWIDMFIPTADAWQGGDHTGMCTLVVFDDDLNLTTTSGSGRAGGSSA